MKLRRLIILLMIISISPSAFSQTASEFNKLSKSYLKKSLDSAEYFAGRAIEVAKEQNQDNELGLAYKNQGTIHYLKGDKKKAIALYKTAIPYFEQAKNLTELANINHNLGLMHYKMNDTENAIAYYKKSLEVQKQNGTLFNAISTFNGLAVLYQETSRFDSSNYYLTKAVKIIDKTDTSLTANLYNTIGRNYSYQSKPDSALYYYKLSLGLSKLQNDSLAMALAIENIGKMLSENQEDSAISCFYTAMKIYENHNKTERLARVKNNLAGIYWNIKDTIESEKFYLSALALYKQLGNKIGEARVYNNLGNLYLNRDFEKSRFWFLESVNIFKSTDYQSQLAITYGNLASLSAEYGHFNDAVIYINKSNKIALRLNIIELYYNNSYILANIYRKQQKYDKALKSLAFTDTLGVQKVVGRSKYVKRLQLISLLYFKTEQYKEAYTTLNLYDSLKSAYLNEEHFKTIAEIDTKYQTDKTEKENRIFKLLNEKQKERIKTNQNLLLLSIGVLFFAFLGVVLLIINNRIKKRNNAQLMAKNEIISEQNQEIEKQLDLLAKQKDILEYQKQNITDSINYAKRFQTAIIPTEQQFRKIFSKAFVFYKPRDIVSGDFYYTFDNQYYKYCLAGDCTGHGVPGAFLSIIAHNAIAGALKRAKQVELKDVVKFTNQYLYDMLHQNLKMDINDGVDFTLIRICEEAKTIDFCGAQNPLVHVSNKDLKVYKTDKFSLGTVYDYEYQIQSLKYQEGDWVYLFSDGYPDQFGGLKDKKFMKKRFYENLKSFSSMSPEMQYSMHRDVFKQWKQNREQVDDILLIGIELA